MLYVPGPRRYSLGCRTFARWSWWHDLSVYHHVPSSVPRLSPVLDVLVSRPSRWKSSAWHCKGNLTLQMRVRRRRLETTTTILIKRAVATVHPSEVNITWVCLIIQHIDYSTHIPIGKFHLGFCNFFLGLFLLLKQFLEFSCRILDLKGQLWIFTFHRQFL